MFLVMNDPDSLYAGDTDTQAAKDTSLTVSAAKVADMAQKYTPWTSAILLVLVGAYLWEEIGDPIVSSLGSNGYYPMDTALTHVKLNLSASAATIPLLWGAWELRCFLDQLANAYLWSPSAPRHLMRAGLAMILAGITAMIISPILTTLLAGSEPFTLHKLRYDPLYLGLICFGAVLHLIARIFSHASAAARALDAENNQFI